MTSPDFERVVVDDVVKLYGPTRVLAGANAVFRAGEVTTLEGPNGSGKSTLLSILAQLARPTRGRVRFGDRVAHPSDEALRGRIGLLAHQALVYPDLSPRENLALFARVYRVPEPRAAVEGAIARFELEAFVDRPVRTLSRGQLQRTALARALVHAPRLLLLDEPSTGLDVKSHARLVDMIREERDRGAIVVVVTHDELLVDRAADRRLRIHRGRIRDEEPTS